VGLGISTSACGQCHACACVFVCICMCIRMYVGIYICTFFCSECYMHFTVVLGTSAWTGVYVTQVRFYTNVHICEHTRCRLCTYICVYMQAYAYGCVGVYNIAGHVEALLLGLSMCVYVCICMRMYMCVHVCVYSACVYVCICIYVCLCICMHIHLYTRACGCTYALV